MSLHAWAVALTVMATAAFAIVLSLILWTTPPANTPACPDPISDDAEEA